MILRETEPITTAWVRQGECNHCGWCCQFIGRRTMKFTGRSEDYDRYYLELRGATMDSNRTGTAPIAIFLPCTAHDNEAKRCEVYERRPRTCRDFPWNPEQAQGIPCSYWFSRTVNGQEEIIAGDGAPEDIRLRVKGGTP